MENTTRQDVNINENREGEEMLVNEGTATNPIECLQCRELSVIESVCSDGCDQPYDGPEISTEQPEKVWRKYEIDEIGSPTVVGDLLENDWSWSPTPLAAAIEADHFGDRPVISLGELEILAEVSRESLTESVFENLDTLLSDDFSELDNLQNKQIRSELGVNTGFTQRHFRNANGR